MQYKQVRENMVECQLKTNGIVQDNLVHLFAGLPREEFFPDSLKTRAYLDESVEVCEGRWSLEPLVEARILKALNLSGDDVVLVVGASSPALIAYTAQMAATVIVIDSDESLLQQAREACLAHDYCNVVFERTEKMAQGYAEQAPFDNVVICGAVCGTPDVLVEQVVEGGRLIYIKRDTERCPGELVLSEKGANAASEYVIANANVPFLQGFEPCNTFKF